MVELKDKPKKKADLGAIAFARTTRLSKELAELKADLIRLGIIKSTPPKT